jgi:ATP-dependent DNA helicase RecG
MSFTKEQLELYIQQGEGYNLEFKESYSANIAKEICAFANANGGKILLGVNDNGKVTGINITNRLKSQIQDIGRNMDPPVNFLITVMDNIVIIDVPGGSNKPYSTNGKFYLRYGSNSQQLRRNEIITFFQKEGVVRFDEKMNYDFNLKKDLSSEKFNRFLKMSGISIVLETETILKNLELVKDSNIRNAGVLFFCEKVTRFFLNATITCVLFQGKDKYKILDRKEFESDIFSNYLDALNYLRSKLNTEYIIKGGPREEKLELPEEALREAILNAIAHRNYFLNSNIQIYIFSDRVEITNPGGLPAGMSYSDLGKKSMPRNFLLFGLMQRMNLVEKIGSGILRIKNAIEEYKLEEPLIEVNENWFTIIFKRPELQKESFEGRKDILQERNWLILLG